MSTWMDQAADRRAAVLGVAGVGGADSATWLYATCHFLTTKMASESWRDNRRRRIQGTFQRATMELP